MTETATEEVRTVSSTGGKKGQKIQRVDLLPVGPLLKVAEHFGRGAEKYTERDEQGNVTHDGANNWRLGYDWSLSYQSLMRHALQFWAGEDIDEEIGTPHLAAVVFHAFALLEFMETHREFDNRPTLPLINGASSAGGITPMGVRWEVFEETFDAIDEVPEVHEFAIDSEGDFWRRLASGYWVVNTANSPSDAAFWSPASWCAAPARTEIDPGLTFHAVGTK